MSNHLWLARCSELQTLCQSARGSAETIHDPQITRYPVIREETPRTMRPPISAHRYGAGRGEPCPDIVQSGIHEVLPVELAKGVASYV
jgi:hypothetical protein